MVSGEGDKERCHSTGGGSDVPPWAGRFHCCDNQEIEDEQGVEPREPGVDDYTLGLFYPQPERIAEEECQCQRCAHYGQKQRAGAVARHQAYYRCYHHCVKHFAVVEGVKPAVSYELIHAVKIQIFHVTGAKKCTFFIVNEM